MIRAVVDTTHGKQYISVEALTVKESHSVGSGHLSRLMAPLEQFNDLEIERDINIQILENGNWEEIWDGMIYDPKIILSDDPRASCLGRMHTAKLINTYIDSDYYFDAVGYVVGQLMKDNGYKLGNIENNPAYRLENGDVSNWTSGGSWSSEGKTYTGNDGSFNETVYDLYSRGDFLMRADISVTSGSNYGFIFGYVDSNNYYYYDFGSNEFHGVYGGIDNDLAHINPAGTADGSNVRIWREGYEIAIAIGNSNVPDFVWENSHTVGRCGLFVNNANVDFTNFEIFPGPSTIKHFTPTRVTIMDAVRHLRLLSFAANSDGSDFYLDRDNKFHWSYRDLSEEPVMTFTENDNILSGTLEQVYDDVRQKISVYGSIGSIEIPNTFLSPTYFISGQDWYDTGNWSTWNFASDYIQMNENDEQTTGFNLYPKTEAGRNLGIPTSTFDLAEFQTRKIGSVTNYNINVRFYKDASTYIEKNIPDGGGAAGVWTDFSQDLSAIDEINFIGIQITCGTLAGGDPMSAQFRNLKFINSGGATDFLITSTDDETGFDEIKEYEETNLIVSSINAAKDYVAGLKGFKKLARLKGEFVVPGNTLLRAGKNIFVDIPSANIKEVVRITEAKHAVSDSGYIVTLTINEGKSLVADEFTEAFRRINESATRDVPATFTTITI